MKTTAAMTVGIAVVLSGALLAQEPKPVPRGSMRVRIPGCTKGYVFTAGPRTADEAGSVDMPQGTHVRMNGPKKMMAEIKAHEGSMIEITGLMKKGQYLPGGVGVGGGVRISPGSAPAGGGMSPSPTTSQAFIDVEGWRPVAGSCPSR